MTATADALLKTQAKNNNTGTSPTIPVKVTVGQDDTTRAIVKFDQAAIAATVGSGTLIGASLELAVKESGSNAAGNDIDVHRVLKPWTEAGVTWKCGEDLDTANVGADCPATKWKMSGPGLDAFVAARTARVHLTPAQTGVARFDVTSDVEAFLAGGSNHGWLVNAGSATSRALFWARESTIKPHLVLAIEVQASVPPEAPDLIPEWMYSDTNIAANGSASIAARFTKRIVVVQFQPEATLAQREAAATAVGGVVVGGVPISEGEGQYYLRIEDVDGAVLLSKAAELRAMPQVASAFVNVAGEDQYLLPNDGTGWTTADWAVDPRFMNPLTATWAQTAINAPLAWGCTTGESPTAVAVVDSDFRVGENQTLFRDLQGMSRRTARGSNRSGHGAGIAGLLGAKGNNDDGMTGMLWDADVRLYDYTIHQIGTDVAPKAQYASAMAAEVQHAAYDGARVINLSQALNWSDQKPAGLGTLGQQRARDEMSWALRGALQTMFARGFRPLVVLAAGNYGVDASWSGFPLVRDAFPAQVLTVGGSTGANGFWSFSNTGAYVDVLAPAEEVSTFIGTGEIFPQFGTSLSAPLVSGIAGLLFSFDSTLTTAEVRQLIVDGAVRANRAIIKNGRTYYMADAYESLKLAAERDGAPLCGNRTFLDGPTFKTLRASGPEPLGTLDADTYSNFFSYGAFTGSIAVQHGGKSVLVCVGPSYCGEYLTFQNEAWTTTQTPPGEERVSDSGPRNSILGLTHDGDSMATVTQTGTGSYAGVYEVRMVSVSTGQGRVVGTLISQRTYNFGMDVSVAPGGDFLLLMGQWATPLPPPDNWEGHADLYRMSLANGSSSLLRTWSNTALLGAQIAEDGREAVLVVNGANTCAYEYISLPGGGTLQTVPSSISYCDRHESRGTFLRSPLSSASQRE